MVDFKEKVNFYSYKIMRDDLKARAVMIRALRNCALEQQGDIRYIIQNNVKNNSYQARLYHVALSFLRGRKYSQVEKNPKEPINKDVLLKFLNDKVLHNYKKNLDQELDWFFKE